MISVTLTANDSSLLELSKNAAYYDASVPANVWHPRIYLYDSKRILIDKGWNSLTKKLDFGLYSARVRIAGKSQITYFKVEQKTKTINLNTPTQISNIPFKNTCNPIDQIIKSNLALTFELPKSFNLLRNDSFHLELLDKNSEKFEYDTIYNSYGKNWVTLVFNDLPSGIFLLTNRSQFICIQIYENFRLHLFTKASVLSPRMYQIDFASFRCNAGAHGEKINFSHATRLIDLVIQELASGEKILSKAHRNILLQEKFNDPIIGLLMLTLYLQWDEPPSVFELVFINTLRMLSNSNDLASVVLIAKKKWALDIENGQYKGKISIPELTGPPIIRRLFEMLSEYNCTDSLQINKLFSRLFKYAVLSSSPFTAFKIQKSGASFIRLTQTLSYGRNESNQMFESISEKLSLIEILDNHYPGNIESQTSFTKKL